ncbi:anti-sigma factor [Mycolicibacterium fortuitum]
MRCNELAELLTEYLDDSLGSSDHVRLETHLSECAGCANYRTQYISTIAILNQIPVAGFKRTLRDRYRRTFTNGAAELRRATEFSSATMDTPTLLPSAPIGL